MLFPVVACTRPNWLTGHKSYDYSKYHWDS